MKDKILIEIQEIKNIWNLFLDEIAFINEIDLNFLEKFQKTLNKINNKFKKIENFKLNIYRKENVFGDKKEIFEIKELLEKEKNNV
ncbi:hypothetical protein [Spiroplasma endosymbiont of Cantharis lateralis]|uniref:hypothetical protein n=1 Tax=Spiroplasma endosymbiont of Cantharis lateralis TaxID=3066277 RepID=UPI00313D0414